MSAGKSDVLLARERAEWLRSLAASDKPSDLSPKRPDERLALADLLTRMADALATREADAALLGRAEGVLQAVKAEVVLPRTWVDQIAALLTDLAARRQP